MAVDCKGYRWEIFLVHKKYYKCSCEGHKNLANLIKNYDLTVEGEGLANFAAAIATGPEVAQGGDFEQVRLETKRAPRAQARPTRNVFQPDFPFKMEEKLSRKREASKDITEEIVLSDDDDENEDVTKCDDLCENDNKLGYIEKQQKMLDFFNQKKPAVSMNSLSTSYPKKKKVSATMTSSSLEVSQDPCQASASPTAFQSRHQYQVPQAPWSPHPNQAQYTTPLQFPYQQHFSALAPQHQMVLAPQPQMVPPPQMALPAQPQLTLAPQPQMIAPQPQIYQFLPPQHFLSPQFMQMSSLGSSGMFQGLQQLPSAPYHGECGPHEPAEEPAHRVPPRHDGEASPRGPPSFQEVRKVQVKVKNGF